MDRFFKKLPLPFKLFLLALVPIALIIYLSISSYRDKSEKVSLLRSYVRVINEAADLSTVINHLQYERRYSYFYTLTKRSEYWNDVLRQRKLTDSCIALLDKYQGDLSLKNFRVYSFLGSLDSMRTKIDSTVSEDQVMHFYTTAIFRVKSLTYIATSNNKLIEPVYRELITGSILNEMTTYLGIIRINFYHAMYKKQNNILMLYGLKGPYDIYTSYEKELLEKAPDSLMQTYRNMMDHGSLGVTVKYINKVFERFSFDSTYDPNTWLAISNSATDSLKKIQGSIMKVARDNVEGRYKKELRARNVNLAFMICAFIAVIFFMLYTIRVLTSILSHLQWSAQRIASGAEVGTMPDLPDDVIGSLATSIGAIESNQKKLTKAAMAIGKGDFDTEVKPRSNEDALGHALLAMRENLKKSRLEIETHREEFRKIANTAPVMLWMTDENGKCVFVNESWTKFTGYGTQHESSRGWLRGVYPEDLERATQTFQQAEACQESFAMEYRLKRKDGVYRWVSDTGEPRFNTEGKFEGFIGSCSDIHEMKEHETRKDSFIAMASHELKTPVTSIKGYIQLMLRMFYEYERTRILPPEEAVRSSLTTIERQADKLSRLLTDLLDLSRIDQGSLNIQMSPFRLDELIEETVQEVRQTISKDRINVFNLMAVDVNADRDRIAQVIRNLLNNALKYSPADEKVDIYMDTTDDVVVVSVKDRGIGIDPLEQAKIFERFYRAEGKTETYPGFGIGLFIADEILKSHGGKISVKSQPQKGSTFTFTFPRIT